uniref:Putative acetyltransferase n=1 Tax=termite gut metagenome TaxID=433724 RepID=S0DDW2_9ZZZZ
MNRMVTEHALHGGGILMLAPSAPRDAAEVLQFLNCAAGESDFLSARQGEFRFTVPQEEAFLRAQAQQPNCLHLTGKVQGRVMALAGLAAPWQPRIAHTAELSIVVGRAFWRQGAGRAVVGRLLDFARAGGQTKLVHLGVNARNHGAIALYRGFGFEQVGALPGYFNVDSEYIDELLMTLTL